MNDDALELALAFLSWFGVPSDSETQSAAEAPQSDLVPLWRLDARPGAPRWAIALDVRKNSGHLRADRVRDSISRGFALGARTLVIVCDSPWTHETHTELAKATLDVRVLDDEEVQQFFSPGRWSRCPRCPTDPIELFEERFEGAGLGCMYGQCSRCLVTVVACTECGEGLALTPKQSAACGCGGIWSASGEGTVLGERQDGADDAGRIR